MKQKVLFEVKKFKDRNISDNFLVKSVFFSDQKKVKNIEESIKKLPKNSAIIIREYHLNDKERLRFAKKIVKLTKKRGIKTLIGKNIALAKEIGADGVHFSDFDKLPINLRTNRKFKKNFIFSYSCHSERSLQKAYKINPDMVFISPIFKTTSHPGTKALGLKNLAKIAFKNKNHSYLPLKIYALGGINLVKLKSIRKLPISGFGAIDLFI